MAQERTGREHRSYSPAPTLVVAHTYEYEIDADKLNEYMRDTERIWPRPSLNEYLSGQSSPSNVIAKLKGSILSGVDLKGANLSGSILHSLRRGSLKGAQLSNCQITGSWEDVNLKGATIDGCNIEDTSFRRVRFDDGYLDDTALKRVQFENCSFADTKISHVDFKEAQITESLMTRAVMKGCRFKHSAITHTDLSGVTGKQCSFEGGKLEACTVTGSQLFKDKNLTKIWRANRNEKGGSNIKISEMKGSQKFDGNWLFSFAKTILSSWIAKESVVVLGVAVAAFASLSPIGMLAVGVGVAGALFIGQKYSDEISMLGDRLSQYGQDIKKRISGFFTGGKEEQQKPERERARPEQREGHSRESGRIRQRSRTPSLDIQTKVEESERRRTREASDSEPLPRRGDAHHSQDGLRDQERR